MNVKLINRSKQSYVMGQSCRSQLYHYDNNHKHNNQQQQQQQQQYHHYHSNLFHHGADNISIYMLMSSMFVIFGKNVPILLAIIIWLTFSSLEPTLAHSPPRSNYYEPIGSNSNANSVRSALASIRFGRFSNNPYYPSSSLNRHYNPSSSSSSSSSTPTLLPGSKTEARSPTNSRSLTDPYYYYDLHREPTVHEPSPIPACKDLRIMWLANQFARFHNIYQENHHKGLHWISKLPEIAEILAMVLKQKSTMATQPSDQTKSKSTLIESDDSPSPFGKIMSTNPNMKAPVYITKIVPSTDNELITPSQSDEMSFGVIHTSPDDDDNDREELFEPNSNSIRRKEISSPLSSSSSKYETKLIGVNKERTGTFGKFLENDTKKSPQNSNPNGGATLVRTVPASNSKSNNNYRTIDGKQPQQQQQRLQQESNKNGSNRSRFQSNRMPGIWHNKPVVPSVRII